MGNRSHIPLASPLPVDDTPMKNAGGRPCLKSDVIEYDAYDRQLMDAWSWEGNPNAEDPAMPGSGGQKS